jgi:HSP20 family protein
MLEVRSMTAHRPRRTEFVDEVGLADVLLFGASWPRSGRRGAIWVPPTDVYETENQIVVQVEVAGVKVSDLAVSLQDRRLIITGTRSDRGPSQRAYHQMQVRFGDFGADVELTAPIDESGIEASYADGFLRIILPKRKPRQIDVQE